MSWTGRAAGLWRALHLAGCVLLWSATTRGAEPGASLTISLLTMGPGEHPFTKFGHSAIWVHDAAAGRDEVYNFGTFEFDSPTLFLDSAQGKLPYWLSVQSWGGTLRSYGEAGRSLLSSELELTPAQRQALYAALRENEKPEHRFYRYDFYRDNCATRIRDALDLAIGGRMRMLSQKPARMSYRAHTLRLVGDDWLLYAALDWAIGRGTDAPITFWDEGFLPARLHDLLLNTNVVHDGQRLPFVRGERLFFPSQLPEPRATPPDWLGHYVKAGLGLGALLAALGLAAHYGSRLRGVLALALTLVGLLFGVLGCALCYLTFVSWHFAAASNYNVLLLPPWLLMLAGVGPSLARGKAWAWGLARWLTGSAALSSVIAVAAHVLQRNPQQNCQELCFALPLWLGAAAAARLAPR